MDPPREGATAAKTISLVRFTSQIDVQSSICVFNVEEKSVADKSALIAQQAENYTLVMNSVLGVFSAETKAPLAIIAVEATEDSRLALKLIQVFIKCAQTSQIHLFHSGLASASVTAISVSSCAQISGITDVTIVNDDTICTKSL